MMAVGSASLHTMLASITRGGAGQTQCARLSIGARMFASSLWRMEAISPVAAPAAVAAANPSGTPPTFQDLAASSKQYQGHNTTPAVATLKGKNFRTVLWKLNGTFNRHNTHLALLAVVEDLDFVQKNPNMSYNEQVMYYLRLPHHLKLHVSAGQLGFRKAQRAEYEAGYQVSSKMFKLIEEKRLLAPNDKIELVLKNFGKGREAFLAALQGKEGTAIKPHVTRISDDTKIKFGGVRAKKARRL